MLTLDSLYKHLRKLVADKFRIEIRDADEYGKSNVALIDKSDKYHWTHFYGKTLEDALKRAIDKLENPEKDYVALDGYVWKASESSVYDSKHIRSFLKKGGGLER